MHIFTFQKTNIFLTFLNKKFFLPLRSSFWLLPPDKKNIEICYPLCLVSGAGDCLTAGFLAAMLRGADQHAAVAAGMQGRTDQHAAVAAGM